MKPQPIPARIEQYTPLSWTKPFAIVTFFLCGLLILVFSIFLKADDTGLLGKITVWGLIGFTGLVCLAMLTILVRPTRRLLVILEPGAQAGSVQIWADSTLEQRIDFGGTSPTPFHFSYRLVEVRERSQTIRYHQVTVTYGNPEETALVRQLPSEEKARELVIALSEAYGRSPGPDLTSHSREDGENKR